MAETGNITITDSVAWTVGTTEYNTTATKAIANGQKPLQQVVAVLTASETEILKVGTTGVAGEIPDISFLNITNKDENNWCRIRRNVTGGHAFDEKLLPGETTKVNNTDISVSATSAAFGGSFNTIDTVSAQFDTADGELEITAGTV